ncbi:MAG TPA: hypothetical protein VMY42_12915 [Thermoguttaceae bacterium]|nr:hypothetical protein [Thermoguttaceae bacterium]
MNRLRRFSHTFRIATAAAVCWLALHGTALAAPPQEEGDKGAAWFLGYALVVLGIGLGMLFVGRSSRRREEAKKEMFAETDKDASDQDFHLTR